MKKITTRLMLVILLFTFIKINEPFIIPANHTIKTTSQFNHYLKDLRKQQQSKGYVMMNMSEVADGDDALTYTTTNNQIASIDEADVLKTNGYTTYYLHNNRLMVVSSNPNKSIALETSLDLTNDEDVLYTQLLLMEDYLIVIGHQQTSWCGFNESTDDQDMLDESFCGMSRGVFAATTVVGVLNRHEPIELPFDQHLMVEGHALAVRLMNDEVFVITQKYNDHLLYQQEPIHVEDVLASRMYNQQVLTKQADNIRVSLPNSLNTLTLTRLDVKQQKVNSSTYMGDASIVLLSEVGLIVSSTDYYDWQHPKTNLTLLDVYDDLRVVASIQQSGYLLNSYAMDYYDGFIRIAITQPKDSTTDNAIVVFDHQLNQVSKLDHLAYDETIYSVLFKQEVAYVVTFKQVDPFFVIDLSNPKNPTVAGELKIPGYSSYLHQVDEHTVIGFGKDVKVDQGFVSLGGFKISLFDVSNPNQPLEKDMLLSGDAYTTSEILYNPRALMVEPTKRLFGFSLLDDGYQMISQDESIIDRQHRYVLLQVNNSTMDVIINEPSSSNQTYVRSMVVNDTLMVFFDQSCDVYDLNTLDKQTIFY